MPSFGYSGTVEADNEPHTYVERKEPIVEFTTIIKSRESEVDNTEHRAKRRISLPVKQLYLLLSLLLGLAWLAPITYLLVVNLREDTIGASAWCGERQTCSAISYEPDSNTTTFDLAAKFETKNHNLLGALQFVAKALEVWFIFIAASLVWYLTVLLAKRPGGLPIGYLLSHLEFGDLRTIVNPLLYRTASASKSRDGGRAHVFHTRLFVFVIILMCLLANLMGPSVAVLVLPTLSWHESGQFLDGQFLRNLADAAPSGADAIPGCSAEELDFGLWNCTQHNYASSLDALFGTVTQETQQLADTLDNFQKNDLLGEAYGIQNSAVLIEQSIPFSFNYSRPVPSKDNSTRTATANSQFLWSFSRQTLRNLSGDFQNLYNVIRNTTREDDPTAQMLVNRYQPYSNSLDLVLQRFGPLVGFLFDQPSGTPENAVYGDVLVTQVAYDRQIRCYQYFKEDGRAKCMRTGPGWNASNAVSSFTIETGSDITMPIEVTAYWSDKAVFSQSNNRCFPNGTLTSDTDCDYDSIFNTPTTADDSDRMQDIFVAEFKVSDVNGSSQAVVMEALPYWGFATYEIDVTEIYPALPPVRVHNTPEGGKIQPLVMHPAWYLAAWGIEEKGTVTLSSDRGFHMASVLTDIVNATLFNNSIGEFRDDPWFMASNEFQWYASYAMAQAASLVPYTLGPNATDAESLPASQPQLWSKVYYQAWGWGGFKDSRTHVLGIVVCALGSLTVIARTLLLVITRIKERSSLDIVTTAIEHRHRGELDAKTKEVERARTRYRFLEDREEELRLLHVT